MNEQIESLLNFEQTVRFISNQIFSVKEGKIKCRKNKRAAPNFEPFEKEELGSSLTLHEDDVILVIPQVLLDQYAEKLTLSQKK